MQKFKKYENYGIDFLKHPGLEVQCILKYETLRARFFHCTYGGKNTDSWFQQQGGDCVIFSFGKV